MVQNNANALDTIVAEATPRGRGGVGIVRVSGPKTESIAQKIIGRVPKARVAEHHGFIDSQSEVIDQGIVLFFKAPHSFTGEDVLELHGHGSSMAIDSLIRETVKLGARLARPGEFSERAFLNNKIDLVQAEAILELINANSEQAARSAARSLQGVFSKEIEALLQELIALRMYVESAIDFPEEELDFLNEGHIHTRLLKLTQRLEAITRQAQQGALLANGAKVVIAGKPNAGKSTLLNYLAGQEAAIVTDIPGTTRDVLREQIIMDGLLLQLVDTAGLRESEDKVEQEGIRRALKEVSTADHVIWVVDGEETLETDPKQLFSDWHSTLSKGTKITVLVNKIDKVQKEAALINKEDHTVIQVSLKTGAGLALFREHIVQSIGLFGAEEGNFCARQRHLDALSRAKKHFVLAEEQWVVFKAGELLAEELRLAQTALDEITGRFTSDDLLGKIFSEFCIGK